MVFKMEDKIQQFKQLVEENNNIVFFGGAGVSKESGIPDFRSKDGLYNQKQGKLKAVITQNIDGLHQKAGSKNVYELHRKCT